MKPLLLPLCAVGPLLLLSSCVDPYYAGGVGLPPGPPPPVVIRERPVVVAPRPVYTSPRPVYVSPRPVYRRPYAVPPPRYNPYPRY